ncbi:ankyrin repeat domain-containing protein SOWAHB [Excalfactoria chinensis]|uniref:ankyrin repeat domain-containing protein SOWAHB n=1 Tax=Excalfactoria chinensis TaxID=46218 RepID=UPI003B3AF7BE
MARELSQEAVLDFLWAAGGRAPNAALLRHFQGFLRDPALTDAQRGERRERFKRLVNAVATVQPAAAGTSKDIVLRRRYRDLLDEELPPQEKEPEEKKEEEEKEPSPPPRCDPCRRRDHPGKGRSGGGQPGGAAAVAGCTARGRGGLCLECRRALRDAAAASPPPPYRNLLGPPPYRAPQPPSAGPSPSPSRCPQRPPPPVGSASVRSLPPPGPRELLPARSPLLSAGPRVPPLSGPPRARSPRPSPPEPSPAQSLPLLSVPEMLPLSQSRSLQTLTAGHSPSPSLLLSGPHALPLPLSRSLQTLSTRLPPSSREGPKVRTSNGPARPRAVLLDTAGSPLPPTLALPAGPGGLPPCSQPSPASPLLSRSALPASDPQGPPASTPPASIPVFRSIRCQLALLEVPDDRGRPFRAVPQRSSSMHVPSRGPTVPLGRRAHAWLVAVSAGRWAHVRELFLEEPELALQRDFMSGFTVLHWLAKHGDGPGLQELAKAARRAGLALDVDARSGCGYTPLHLAAIHGHTLVIKVLVQQMGCQVQVRDGNGRQPWEYLGSSTSGEIWQLLQAPRGTIMFPTQPLARSVSSASKVLPPAGRAPLAACLKPQRGRRAAPHQAGSESD